MTSSRSWPRRRPPTATKTTSRAADWLDAEWIRAEQLRRSLRLFIEEAWPHVEQQPFVPGWHIDTICEHLEAVTAGDMRDLLINVPPRHMKSLATCVFWPAWEWLTRPELRYLCSSYSHTLSVRDSLRHRRLVESPWYRRLLTVLEQRWAITDDQGLKSRWETTAGGLRVAASVGGGATGEGGDRLICDDPHQIQDAHSATKLEAAVTWWDETMSSRLNDPQASCRVVVMQRVHERDLAGHLAGRDGWHVLCLPARFESDHPRRYPRDPRRRPGELLWPQRFGEREIKTLERDLGSYAAAGQLQQRPAPAGGGMIKRGWFRTYRAVPADLDEIVQSWDCAFKDETTSDYVVGQVWARRGGERYLLDVLRDQLDFPATCQAIRSLSAKWPEARLKLVEDKANGPAVIAALRREVGGLVPVEPQGGKIARAAACSPAIEAGNVYVPEQAPWLEDFLGEIGRFPNGAYDDQVDAMTQALLRFEQAGQAALVGVYVAGGTAARPARDPRYDVE